MTGSTRDAKRPPTAGDERHSAATEKLETASAASVRRFVFVIIAVAALLMAAVACSNALIDPLGTTGAGIFPTATTSDRTVKLDLIERLSQSPQAIILGSSRAMRFEPTFFQSQTGMRTFNASVNGVGGVIDAFALTSWLSDRFPSVKLHYFWLIDVESFVPVDLASRLTGEPRLAKYINGKGSGAGTIQSLKTRLDDLATLLSWATAHESARIVADTSGARKAAQDLRNLYQADGFLKSSAVTPAVWKARFPYSQARYTQLYRTSYKKLDGQAVSYFERTLALMNSRGSQPLIVLSPVQPQLLAQLKPLGWDERHRQVLALLDSLHARYKFRVVDMTLVSSFKGDPAQFYDGVHMTPLNSRLLAAAVLRQTGGTF